MPWGEKRVKMGLISVSIIFGNGNYICTYINVLVHVKQKCFMHLKIILNNDDDGNQKSHVPHYNIKRAGEKKSRSGRWMFRYGLKRRYALISLSAQTKISPCSLPGNSQY